MKKYQRYSPCHGVRVGVKNYGLKSNRKFIPKKIKISGAIFAIGLVSYCIKVWYSSYKKMQINEQLHKNKIEEIIEKGKVEKDVDNNKADIKEKQEKQKKEDREARKMEKEEERKSSITSGVDLPEDTYRPIEKIMCSPAVDVSILRLMFSFLHIGVDLGFVGPNNCGKTSLINQIIFSLALGRCICNLWPDSSPAKPMQALMFTTEQNDNDIKVLYKDFADGKTLDNLNVVTEELVSPASIIIGIEKHINTTDSRGLVVSIDNYTSLIRKYGKKAINELNQKLDELKAKYADTHPLTIIKVYHTNDQFSPYRPLKLDDVRAFQDNINTTKNFIGLAPCKEGQDKRILYVLKNKLEPKTQGAYVIRYAHTEAPFYTFDHSVEDINEVLPIRNTTAGKSENSGKRGRPSNFTNDEIMELYRLNKEEGKTWQTIQLEYGISGPAIKKRRKEILAKKKKV